jgi:hypothetical protein
VLALAIPLSLSGKDFGCIYHSKVSSFFVKKLDTLYLKRFYVWFCADLSLTFLDKKLSLGLAEKT